MAGLLKFQITLKTSQSTILLRFPDAKNPTGLAGQSAKGLDSLCPVDEESCRLSGCVQPNCTGEAMSNDVIGGTIGRLLNTKPVQLDLFGEPVYVGANVPPV